MKLGGTSFRSTPYHHYTLFLDPYGRIGILWNERYFHERSDPVHNPDGFCLRPVRYRSYMESCTGTATSSPYRGRTRLLVTGNHSSGVETLMLILLIVLILLFGVGGNFYNGGAYRTGGFGLGGILIVILIILLLTGRL